MTYLSEITIRPLQQNDQDWVTTFIQEQWGTDIVVGHDQVYTPADLPGFVAKHLDVVVGLITYSLSDTDCEIVTIDSTIENRGIGTVLIEAVEQFARQHGCTRLWLVTTNDNMHALGFYQKRGFRIVGVNIGAVERARILKPAIPLVADNGIPILDELVLEKKL